MNPKIKGSLLILLVLVLFASSGIFEGSVICTNRLGLLHKGGDVAKSRKLMGFDAVLDYDYAGPNPKHDPRGKKGGGGRNP